eukprot:maker-scaffold_73-snap-gene-0.0-mRNA-1 protein AED:0.28 eAED:0.28 QI:142/1/1/1/1/1/2/64/372
MTESKQTVLVAGGAGYIGTHTAVCLIEAGFNVIILDNLDNSSLKAVERVREITSLPKSSSSLEFHQIDLTNFEDLSNLFKTFPKLSACIHFAALKAVGESTTLPLHYYFNNLTSSLHLLNLLQANKCNNFIFSSSATVYGNPSSCPIDETFRVQPTNPYGQTKAMIEQMCIDLCKANPDFNVTLLRYFNPIGSHPSGLIGEDPQGWPNNLLPFVAQVAVGRREKLSVFGKDYDTPDGTGVRDYIHVVDLADGHLAALKQMLVEAKKEENLKIYNLGTGKGVSVLEVVDAFRKASGKEIKVEFAGRRAGDIGECWASVGKAKKELGWIAKYGIEESCRDAWNWQSKNPNGFRSKEELGLKIDRKARVFSMYGQ